MTNPVLFLLFDLGITRGPNNRSALVQVSRTSGRKPDVWAIHSRGHDATVFGCLEHMRCRNSSEKFFTSLKVGENTYYELSRRNKVFSKLKEDFRYPWPDAVHKQGVKRKGNRDEDVESSTSTTPAVAAEYAITEPAAPGPVTSNQNDNTIISVGPRQTKPKKKAAAKEIEKRDSYGDTQMGNM
jgi:hypothetical protein